MTNLLTVRQASEILGFHNRTIRSWLSKRRLPRVSVGRSVRIPAEAVADFVRRNTIPARGSSARR